MPYQAHFDLDLTRAIREQLLEAFEALDTLVLTAALDLNGADIANARGVYGLLMTVNGAEQVVYVGKANRLKARIEDHAHKVSGRHGITIDGVRFKCLTVNPNWAAYAPENILMVHYQALGQCAWNGAGFGPHDPGRNREETNKPPDGFDTLYPIQHQLSCDFIQAGEYNVLELLLLLKRNLPYLLRFQVDNRYRHHEGHADFQNRQVTIPAAGLPADEIMRRVTEALPGWQSTRFPSHMILYHENREYVYGQVIARG